MPRGSACTLRPARARRHPLPRSSPQILSRGRSRVAIRAPGPCPAIFRPRPPCQAEARTGRGRGRTPRSHRPARIRTSSARQIDQNDATATRFDRRPGRHPRARVRQPPLSTGGPASARAKTTPPFITKSTRCSSVTSASARLGVDRATDRLVGRVDRHPLGVLRGRALRGQVDVQVDQPGEHGVIAQVDDRRPRWALEPVEVSAIDPSRTTSVLRRCGASEATSISVPAWAPRPAPPRAHRRGAGTGSPSGGC